MKSRDAVEVNWKFLGAELGALSSEEQVAFFQGFTSELQRYPSRFQAETQCCWIRDGLTKEQRELVATIGFEED